jgi:haloalkane dehalogenase
MSRFAFSELFYLQGVRDRSATPRAEVYAYYQLLKRADGGRAFLRIMRGFELTEEKQRLLWDGLAPDRRSFPAQIVWGAEDPALGEKRRLAVQRVLGIDDPILLPAKHFLPEDQATAIAAAIVALAKRGT